MRPAMKEKTIVYDNVPDMKIKLQDGRIVTLDELEPMVRAAGKLFAYAPWSTNQESATDTDIGLKSSARRSGAVRFQNPDFASVGIAKTACRWI